MPQRFRAPDGTSQFAPANTWRYTTADLLEAEARLLGAGRDSSGPVASYGTVAQVCQQPLPGRDYALAPTRLSPWSRSPPRDGWSTS